MCHTRHERRAVVPPALIIPGAAAATAPITAPPSCPATTSAQAMMDDVYTLDDEDSVHDDEVQFSAASSPTSHEGELVNEEARASPFQVCYPVRSTTAATSATTTTATTTACLGTINTNAIYIEKQSAATITDCVHFNNICRTILPPTAEHKPKFEHTTAQSKTKSETLFYFLMRSLVWKINSANFSALIITI